MLVRDAHPTEERDVTSPVYLCVNNAQAASGRELMHVCQLQECDCAISRAKSNSSSRLMHYAGTALDAPNTATSARSVRIHHSGIFRMSNLILQLKCVVMEQRVEVRRELREG